METKHDLEKLRASEFHRAVGRNFCAAYTAYQMGVTIPTALKNMKAMNLDNEIGDAWLCLAEMARQLMDQALSRVFDGPLGEPPSDQVQ